MSKNGSAASVMDAQCPSRLVLDRIADKWTAIIIQLLAQQTMRYAELHREIGGISQKMLTQTLRSLERDGLVESNWMINAVHLSAIRSRTRRDGHWASKTEAGDDLDMSPFRGSRSQAQGESNIPTGMYR